LVKISVDQALKKVELYIESDKNVEAEKLLEAVLMAFPKHKRAQKQRIKLSKKKQHSSNQLPPQHILDKLLTDYNEGQLGKVVQQAEILTRKYPNSFVIWNILGAASAQLEKLDAAILAFRKVIALKPDYADAYNNIGNVLTSQGKLDEAITAFMRALEINPNYASAYFNIGNAMNDQGSLDNAIGAYKRALEIDPNMADAYHNLGHVLLAKSQPDAALEMLYLALKIRPHFAEAHRNIGNAFKYKDNLNEAISAYRRAIEINPDYVEVHSNLSFALLNNGLVKEGLDEFEWRWQLPDNARSQRHFTQPLWDGAVSLDGKRVLIWSEQGIGDTIIWSSFLPYVADKAAHCILECPEKLMPLMSRSFPNIEVRSENRTADLVRSDFDFHLPMGSLYRQFYSTISSHENKEAFLIPCPDRVEFWKEKLRSLGDGPYVGIGWKSSVTSPERANNYASILEWSPLLKLPNVKFVNLQYSDFVEDLNIVERELGIQVHNFDEIDLFDDLDDVAALCKALDTVVSTTSAVPRIAAGVGTHTKFACWKQSPWNNVLCQLRGPKVEQFDRNTWEPWENIFEAIVNTLVQK
jgi:tetratricopeptide (TPR) repeat protein